MARAVRAIRRALELDKVPATRREILLTIAVGACLVTNPEFGHVLLGFLTLAHATVIGALSG